MHERSDHLVIEALQSGRRAQLPIDLDSRSRDALGRFERRGRASRVSGRTKKWMSVRREKAWFFSRCNSYPVKGRSNR